MTTHTDATRNANATATVTRLDSGAGNGRIELQTAGSAVVATLPYSTKPAYGTPAAGVATASGTTADTNAAGGTVTKAVHKDSDGNEVWTNTAGGPGSGQEYIISPSNVVGAGDTVSFSANPTYTSAV